MSIEMQYLATHEFMALGSTAKADITKCVQADKESSAKGSAELLLLVLLSSRVGDGDTGEVYRVQADGRGKGTRIMQCQNSQFESFAR